MGKNNGNPDLVCEKSRSRGWDKEIPHIVLPLEQLVLGEKIFSDDECFFLSFFGLIFNSIYLILKAPIATKVVCISRLLKCLRSLYGKQCGPRSDCSYRAVCSGSTLFTSILNSSVMLGNYLQQTTSSDDIFRCFFHGALRVNPFRK